MIINILCMFINQHFEMCSLLGKLLKIILRVVTLKQDTRVCTYTIGLNKQETARVMISHAVWR